MMGNGAMIRLMRWQQTSSWRKLYHSKAQVSQGGTLFQCGMLKEARKGCSFKIEHKG